MLHFSKEGKLFCVSLIVEDSLNFCCSALTGEGIPALAHALRFMVTKLNEYELRDGIKHRRET